MSESRHKCSSIERLFSGSAVDRQMLCSKKLRHKLFYAAASAHVSRALRYFLHYNLLVAAIDEKIGD
jgi:hypothetical protein